MANCRKPGVVDSAQPSAAVKDGTLCLAPSPRQGMTGTQPRKAGFRGHGASGSWSDGDSGFRGHGASGYWSSGASSSWGEGDVATWDTDRKLLEAAQRTTPKLPAEMRDEFASLFTKTNLAITAGVLAAWGVSHWFGVGEAIDLILLAVGAFMIGWQIVGVARDLHAFVTIARDAQTEADLERAADHLARVVVTIGITAFIALVMKAGSKFKAGRSTRPSTRPSRSAAKPPAPAPRPVKPPVRQKTLFQGTGKRVNPNRLRNPSDRAAWDIMNKQGRNPRQVRQVLESGKNFKSRQFQRGEKLRGFVSKSNPAKSKGSPYWVDEPTYARLQQKYYKNGKWDSAGVKNEIALPCVNSADAVVETQVTKPHLGVESEVLPAADKVYTMNPDGTVTRSTVNMSGGASQVTPSPDAISPIKPSP